MNELFDQLGNSSDFIPGFGDEPVFTVNGWRTGEAALLPTIPVLIAVPHAGRRYPSSLLQHMRHPDVARMKLEDRYVDKLAKAVADATGAASIMAHAPRAMIDLNRSPDDMDWNMLGRAGFGSPPPSARARSGLGLIPRRLPGLGDLWRGAIAEDDLHERMDRVHAPYHYAITAIMTHLRDHWGTALLVDLHSMPPLPEGADGTSMEIIIGDRFGASCSAGLVSHAFALLAEDGRRVAHNRPYAGGYVLDRHGVPRDSMHAMQLEIDRSLYLDSELIELGDGFAGMVATLTNLIGRLGEEVISLGQYEQQSQFSAAAE